jgi:crotonobetainyl-CoA:carnitine CoA-transferase CaiB-like acyl-CoA transferase
MSEETLEPEVGVLSGLRVLDIAHQYAGGMCASYLADMGADVIAVEHPKGASTRTMLPKKNGSSLYWKVVGRGKRTVTLDFSKPEGRDLLIRLAKELDVDVITENFRPGTLEKWGLGPADLESAGLDCVLLRLSGYGQTGPYRRRPGFGSVGEAMSGFSHLTGFPDGPPVLPSTTLADGVTATFAAVGVLGALCGKLRGTVATGVQVVDASLVESMLRIIPSQIIGYDQIGRIPKRPGNYIGAHGVLRSLYESSDGQYWVLSAVGTSHVLRILRAVGADDMLDSVEPTLLGANQPEIEAMLFTANERVTKWSESHAYDEIHALLAAADVVFERVWDVTDIVADEHLRERQSVTTVPDWEFGEVMMQGITPKFPGHQPSIRWAGRALGADTAEVFADVLQLSAEDLAALKERGVV